MLRSANIAAWLGSFLLAACSVGGAAEAPAGADPDLSRLFEGRRGTIVVVDGQTGRIVRHDPARARRRFTPASTFKIPNSLIALETGVASGPEFPLRRDSSLAPRLSWWPASWSEDHTLATAFPASVVWYYQELARRVGAERMQRFVDRLDYGNRDISGGVDRFWLTGGLAISAEEQVRFLERFHRDELGLAERTTRIARQLLVLEETPEYRLSGKTGWAGLGAPGEPQIGWLVGYLERGDDVHFFATNLDIHEPADAAARMRITRAVLTELGLLPPPASR